VAGGHGDHDWRIEPGIVNRESKVRGGCYIHFFLDTPWNSRP
jgi:hypothetical protein